MTISRRAMMAGTVGLGAAFAFRPLSAQAQTEAGEGYMRTRIGDFEVIALSDGSVQRPLDAGFVRNAPLEDVQAALASAGLPTDHVTNSFSPVVVIADGRHILFDAGFADNGPDGTGLLAENMEAAGIAPGDIDAVVMSHLHPDHVNGLRRSDGTLVYPDAEIWIPQPELDHWMSDERMNAAPEGARGAFRVVRRVLDGYPEGRLNAFAPGTRVAGAIDTAPAFGHTPGHTVLSVGEGAESFTFIGDAAHIPALFVANPDWQLMFDMDPDAARESRHALLARLAEQGGLVAGYHFPAGTIGRIETAGDSYAYSTNG
ncbi:MBL fold metallo-hydrolase [Pararhodobacter sp. SW119]|uniref:MBL fold metallo-hydrolase n=1 Tax=Pararhodobacter sp. SW119 TaxID=2780075 RepID=UPI001ADF9A78|nr:MBL fold metallo-hydrolase [Pararhodobacter sp. SW119]